MHCGRFFLTFSRSRLPAVSTVGLGFCPRGNSECLGPLSRDSPAGVGRQRLRLCLRLPDARHRQRGQRPRGLVGGAAQPSLRDTAIQRGKERKPRNPLQIPAEVRGHQPGPPPFSSSGLRASETGERPLPVVMGFSDLKIHRVEYYSVMKREAVLTQATTWVNLEGGLPGGAGQSQKDKGHVTLKGSNSQEQRVEWWSPGPEGGGGRLCSPLQCQFCKMGGFCSLRAAL